MFKVEFATSNAAFDGDDMGVEVARILRLIADRAEDGEREGVVRDVNGNNVGWFTLTDDAEV